MRALFLFITGMFVSVSVYADKVLIANCAEGGGCTFELSDIESDFLDGDFERKIQPDDILVLGKKKNGEVITYLDKKPREAIDQEWGGDGYTKIGLFNPYLQPTDGTWRASYGSATGNDCYGIGNIGSFIRKRLNPGAAGTGDLYFQYPFNPSQLFPSNEMRWVKTGYHTYRGMLDFSSLHSAGMKMHCQLTIVDRTRIETVYSIEVQVPTKEKCVAKIPLTFTLLKAHLVEDPFENEDPVPDDLLPVHPKNQADDLMEVKPKDDLLPVEPRKKRKPTIPRLEDQPNVPRLDETPLHPVNEK